MENATVVDEMQSNARHIIVRVKEKAAAMVISSDVYLRFDV
jgi:hypothetical protein